MVTVRSPVAVFVLAADAPRAIDHDAALTAAADQVGVPLHVPAEAELAGGLPRTPGTLPLVGTLDWSDAEHGWIAEWSAGWLGAVRHWEVRGVSFDEHTGSACGARSA